MDRDKLDEFMAQIDEIIMAETGDSICDLTERLQIEHDILIGKLPMPPMPPLRVPFIYRKES